MSHFKAKMHQIRIPFVRFSWHSPQVAAMSDVDTAWRRRSRWTLLPCVFVHLSVRLFMEFDTIYIQTSDGKTIFTWLQKTSVSVLHGSDKKNAVFGFGLVTVTALLSCFRLWLYFDFESIFCASTRLGSIKFRGDTEALRGLKTA